jgi:hypothetical protein
MSYFCHFLVIFWKGTYSEIRHFSNIHKVTNSQCLNANISKRKFSTNTKLALSIVIYVNSQIIALNLLNNRYLISIIPNIVKSFDKKCHIHNLTCYNSMVFHTTNTKLYSYVIVYICFLWSLFNCKLEVLLMWYMLSKFCWMSTFVHFLSH